MDELNKFQELVVAMVGSSDNDARNAAEKTYNDVPMKNRAQLLLQLYTTPTINNEIRSASLLLFRRLLSSDYEAFWNSVGNESKSTFCEQFIAFATHEEVPVLRKRLADIIAEIARNTINDSTAKQEWAGVMQFLELCATTEKPALREIGMQLIENVPNIFGSDQEHYMSGIKQMFHSSLLYNSDSQVRTAAVRAYVAFVCDNDENDQVVRSLSDLIPDVIKVCQHVLDTEADDDVPIQCLGDLASSVPKTLTPYLTTICELCLATMSNTEKDESYRHSALEVMVSFCESAPGTMRKKGARFLPSLVEQCLRMMTELDEDVSEWLDCDDLNNQEDEDSVSAGETSLDRICCAVGGKFIMQPLLQVIDQMQKNADWRYRHAAIMGLSTMGEGCKRQMEPLISQIINEMVLPYINDKHPRVRYAVCNCVGQMCTDFAPTAQKKCHEKIIPALISAAGDLSCPRVAAHAGAALVNFSADCPKQIITVYLPDLMSKMEMILDQTFNQMLNCGKKLVLEQVITTIASIADAAENNFADFYGRLASPLKYILANANSKELKELRGKTMECLSLIGVAVGRERFRDDANEIMQTLLQAGIKFDEEDDPEISYMISSWARVCKILGPEFAPYMPHVMPSVMKAAEFQPGINIVDEEEVAQYDEQSWSFISMGDQRSIGIKTDGLEDKLTACEMLVAFARELGPAFAPYVEAVLKFMVTQLKYIFHDGVRSAAADCLPYLVLCVREQGIEAERAVYNQILPALIDSLDNESDLEVLADKLYAFAQLAEHCGQRLFSNDDLVKVCAVVNSQMVRYEERLAEIKKNRKDEELDEDDQAELEDVLELESGVLGRISDIVHYLFIAFQEQFLPYFGPMNEKFAPLLGPGRSWHDRQWATCVYDDVIEYGGKQGRLSYHNIYFQPLLRHLVDEYPEVRQAAAYGIGVLALKGESEFAQPCAQALPILANAINMPNARETEEGVEAVENAISAVAKILKYNSSAFDPNEVIPSFIEWLPIWDDSEELPYVYDYFCDLVEQNNPLVLGPNNSKLGRVFEIILHTFAKGAFEIEDAKEAHLTVKQRLVNIMKMLHQNEQIFHQLISSAHLSAHQQEVLKQILS
ncbi:Importin-5 [Aphelenchoides besseyi]|nr:Importin-5 [Aphelenchoides besseyi]